MFFKLNLFIILILHLSTYCFNSFSTLNKPNLHNPSYQLSPSSKQSNINKFPFLQCSLSLIPSLKKGEILDWKSKSPNIKSVSKKRIPPFTPVNIDFNDVINWVEFSKIGNSKSGRFRFFVLDVNN